MQGFFARIRAGLMDFMRGRYGTDQLGLALMVLSLIFSIVGIWARTWANVVALILLAVVVFRMLSTNLEARRKENQAFLAFVAKPLGWLRLQRTMWENRKTKAYVRCPHCHARFALPKGKGRLRATCPQCGEKSIHTV